MHAHFFGAKRAYYATLRTSRSALAHFGLTPARFDAMTVLLRSFQHQAWQSEIRKALGVARATVARMLRSLEERGFIRRWRSPIEKRQINVRLTSEGLARVAKAQEDVMDTGHVSLAVDSALGDERWFDEGHCLAEKDEAESALNRLRAAFGDRATLYYPWHPDD